MAPTPSLEAIPVRSSCFHISSIISAVKKQKSQQNPTAKLVLTCRASSQGQSQSMVFSRRPSIHHCGFCNGGGHDTGSGIFIFGFGETEIRSDDGLGLYGELLGHHFPMVLLGLFASLFRTRDQWLHWGSYTLWSDEYPRISKSRFPIDPRTSICVLSGIAIAMFTNSDID